MPFNVGDRIRIEYRISLLDGTAIESTEGKPLEVVVGSGQILPGVDRAIAGMDPGGERTVTIKPEDAFGTINHDLVVEIPMERFPEGMTLKRGQTFEIELPSGGKAPATVVDVTVDGVTFDLNHPLAGQSLKVWLRVAGVVQAAPKAPG